MAQLAESSTKMQNKSGPSNGLLYNDPHDPGTDDVTMESQNFTMPSETADWFDIDQIAEIER